MEQNTVILAFSPDDVAGARKMVERQAKEQQGPPNFPLLADPDHRVIDREGRIAWKFTDTDARVRATNEQILEALAPLAGN